MADFSSIAEMMESCAAEAVRSGRRDFGFSLDYSGESIEALETIMANVAASLNPADPNAVEHAVKLWGSYLGETFRRGFGGDWDLVQYPGHVALVPTLIIAGSQLYPLLKAYRRLTLGEAENVWNFYRKIHARLAIVHPTERS